MKLYLGPGIGLVGCKHQQRTFVWAAASLHLEEHKEPHLQCPKGCKNQHLIISEGSAEAVEVDGP